MHLELVEILACPRCGPPQVLVAVVHEAEGHRVRQGFLGCPACDSRFPVGSGTVRLRWDADDPLAAQALTASEDRAISAAPPGTAVLIAALLGFERGRGTVLIGPALSGAADEVASLAEGWEVIALQTPASADDGRIPPATRATRLIVEPGDRLPLLPGRLQAAALAGELTAVRVAEATRVLVPAGRLVVLAPAGGETAILEAAGFAVRASDDRAILATRPVSSGG